MQLPRLNITNTFAQLGIKGNQSSLQMKQPMAELEIDQPQAKIEYSKTKWKLTIDQTEAFADANLKPILRLLKEWAIEAKQHTLQSIAKEASEGSRLMGIEDGELNSIPEIAKDKSQPPLKQVGIGYIPKSADKVRIDYIPSQLKINIEQNKPIIKAEAKNPIIKYIPGDLSIYVKQKASIQMEVIGKSINQTA